MFADEWFVQRCLDLKPGDSEPYEAGGYIIYRWKDGWWALWVTPLPNILGQEFFDAIGLRAFLAGNTVSGIPICFRSHVDPRFELKP